MAALMLLLSTLVASGPSALLLEGPKYLQLHDHQHLPLGFSKAVLNDLSLVFHQNETLAMAFYDPVEGGGRLSLQSLYFDESRTRLALPELTIDQVEALSYALLLAYFHRETLQGKALGDWLHPSTSSSAISSACGINEAVTAAASFGSYLLSLANEIERGARRRKAQGRPGLCQLATQRVGLFQLWETAFAEPFAGNAFDDRGQEIVCDVDARAKRGMVEQVLGSTWAGDALADFGELYCDRGKRGGGP